MLTGSIDLDSDEIQLWLSTPLHYDTLEMPCNDDESDFVMDLSILETEMANTGKAQNKSAKPARKARANSLSENSSFGPDDERALRRTLDKLARQRKAAVRKPVSASSSKQVPARNQGALDWCIRLVKKIQNAPVTVCQEKYSTLSKSDLLVAQMNNFERSFNGQKRILPSQFLPKSSKILGLGRKFQILNILEPIKSGIFFSVFGKKENSMILKPAIDQPIQISNNLKTVQLRDIFSYLCRENLLTVLLDKTKDNFKKPLAKRDSALILISNDEEIEDEHLLKLRDDAFGGRLRPAIDFS